jgi:hypothetical protein
VISPAERKRLNKDIEILEKALKQCTDSGLRHQIIAWIEREKKRLAEGTRRDY